MPTYDYDCQVCGEQWQEEQKITASPTTECPKCHELKARRLISGTTSFILNGRGWEKDGYGDK